MSRILAFAGTASTTGVVLPIDPWSATAEQIALVLADIRSWDAAWSEDDDFEPTDAWLIAEHRATLTAETVVDYRDGDADEDPQGWALHAAWVAMLTPAA